MPAPKGHPPYNRKPGGGWYGGRPIEWTDSLLEQIADELEEWMSSDKASPFAEDFCTQRGMLLDELSTHSKRNERLARTYKLFKQNQKSTLFKGGLVKKYQYNMCYLLLNILHDVVIKTDVGDKEDSKKEVSDQLEKVFGLLSSVQGSLKENKTASSIANKSE